MSQQRPHFSSHSKAKAKYKSTKNPSEEVDYDNYFILRTPEIDFGYETNARKVMADFKLDALYR